MSMTGVLADETITGPECECGCGEYLPYGSTRSYKRGHRNRAQGNYGGRPQNAGPTIDKVSDPDSNWITLADAATETPNDPEPAGQEDHRKPTIRVTKKVRDDIEGKVAMMIMMTSMLLQTKDEVCGKALEDNGPTIAQKFVPIICKSPELVRWFTKGGNYTAWLDLCMALWPVLTVAFGHHVSHSIQDTKPQPGQNGNRPGLHAVPNESYRL
jgi:hypothetical protein